MLGCSCVRQIPRGGGIFNYREQEKKILDQILDSEVYDNRIRPSGTNGTGKGNVDSADFISFTPSFFRFAFEAKIFFMPSVLISFFTFGRKCCTWDAYALWVLG